MRNYAQTKARRLLRLLLVRRRSVPIAAIRKLKMSQVHTTTQLDCDCGNRYDALHRSLHVYAVQSIKRSSRKEAPAASGRERRRDPRYPLTAEARVIDIGSGAEFKARISDLSMTGCYVDFPNPFPDGTAVVIKISRDNGVFETNGKVVFILPRMGWVSGSRTPSLRSKPFSSAGSPKSLPWKALALRWSRVRIPLAPPTPIVRLPTVL